MKNKLLITTAFVALVSAGNALADDYRITNGTELNQTLIDKEIQTYINKDNRVAFVTDENGANPTVTLTEDVKLEAFANMMAPTKIVGGKTMTVKGYLTAGAPNSDLSDIKLVMEKSDKVTGASGATNEGELVLANKITLGDVQMKDGTGIYLYNNGEDENYAEGTKTLTIADGKTMAFEGNTYIAGAAATEQQPVNELSFVGSGTIANNGNITLKKDVTLGKDIKLENQGRLLLDQNVILTANNKLEFDGSKDGQYYGIASVNDNDQGKLVINNGIDLKNGAGVWVNDIEINGGEVNLSGRMEPYNPDQPEWRAGSMLGANNEIKVSNATVNLGEYGQFSAGEGGLSFQNTTINMNGSESKEALLRAWGQSGDDKGLSIDAKSTLNVNGASTISASKTDVSGTINLNDTLNIKDRNNNETAGTLTLNDGAKVVSNVKSNSEYGKIAGNVSLNGDITLETKLANGMTEFTGKVLGAEDGNSVELNDNKVNIVDSALFSGKYDAETQTVTYSKKDSKTIAAETGVSASQAAALLAVTDGESSHQNFNQVANTINSLAQSQNKADVKKALDAVNDMGSDTAPVVRATQTNITNQVFGAVSSQLSGGSVASANKGASSGDALNGIKTWVRTLFSRGKFDSTAKTNGFDSDTYGVAFGADKQIDSQTKVGAGYAYNDTDIDSYHRDTDVKTHTAIVYGEYKPSDWYVNAIASYNWSEYDEKKNIAGINANAKYDVDTLGLQAMTGYDTNVNGYNVTPEAGLRYVRIDRKAYTDNLGSRVSSNTGDILTGVVGVKANKNFTLDNGMNIRPEARIAMTYDLTDDDDNATVTLANGSAYGVDGEDFGRFGVEAGLGIAADISDNWEVSAGYEGHFRSDYNDHTGMLNAKYSF